MKKLKNINGIEPLKRSELAAISGGTSASCVASYGDTVVICQDSRCNATDNIGCLSDIMILNCPSSPALVHSQDHGN